MKNILLLTCISLLGLGGLKSQVVCDFANDSITFCFDATYQSTGGCSLDTVTTGLYFFSRAQDSVGVNSVPTFQNTSGDDGTGMSPSGVANEYCITIHIPSWYGVDSVEQVERITFAIRNEPGTAFLTSSCINNPFGYYAIKALNAVNQQVEDAFGTDLSPSFSSMRDTVCMDTSTMTSIEAIQQQIDLKVFPNPFSSSINVQFRTEGLSFADICITDLLGRNLFTYNTEALQSRNSFSWNGSDKSGKKLPGGIYLLVFTVDGNRIAKKISIIR